MKIHRYFVTAPSGLAELVAEELRELGARAVRVDSGGVGVRGPLAFGYRICLWSRCASRVLLGLAELVAENADALHREVRALPWEEHLDPDRTFAVSVVGTGAGVHNTKFGAQRVKDAIVDRFRERIGRRPSVDLEQPDVRVVVRLHGRGVGVHLDLAGQSLHRRGWRSSAGPAPLKENLAAALLRRAGWPEISRGGGPLVDPMCGAGTLVIEAATLAADIAPALGRSRFGFEGWLGHEPRTWSEVADEARERAERGRARELPVIVGLDQDPAMLEHARRNAAAAGVEGMVSLSCERIEDLSAQSLGLRAAASASEHGALVVANPPHGERLGSKLEARHAHAQLGRAIGRELEGWRAAILTTDDDLPHALGWVPQRRDAVFNGPIPSLMLTGLVGRCDPDPAVSPFANRLRKNLRTIGRWAKRHDVECHRIYDGDIPEYNAAVDRYGRWVHVQEYAPPPSVDPDQAAMRLHEIVAGVVAVFDVPSEDVFVKQRRRHKGKEQYERRGPGGPQQRVTEGDLCFWINLSDYLDTGLFLDHRITRGKLREWASGRRFLNLFAYTGTATAYAAAGGARTTTSVDLSNTYLEWARRNLELNGLEGPQHRFVQADVRRWVERCRDTFDLVFVDPPTYSTSKRMEGDFDVQRDHRGLLESAMRLLAKGGTLVFSTNARRFVLDAALERKFRVEDWTDRTIPEDFARTPTAHRVWCLSR
jgi:23S rRNA (guanine2445-N2)-methyltransferase / 23S rRNA (guanine2069-N7)-methyltransferase